MMDHEFQRALKSFSSREGIENSRGGMHSLMRLHGKR